MTTSDDPFERLRAGDLSGAEAAARAMLVDEDRPDLRHLLGTLLVRRGAFDEGVDQLGLAVAAMPGNVASRTHLVRALIDRGDSAAALRSAGRPLPGPAAGALWRLRAEAARAARAPSEATEAERRAELADIEHSRAAGGVSDPAVTLRRARLLSALAETDAAIDAYRGLLADAPGEIVAIRELGLLLDRANRAEELAALVDGEEDDRLALLRAILAWRARDLDGCADWLDRADPAVEATRFHHLRLRLADAKGDVAGAIAAMNARNATLGDTAALRSASERFRADMRRLETAMTPEWTARVAALAREAHDDGPAPVFLLGFPRSGTTLLDTFLGGHEAVEVLEEIPLIARVDEVAGPIERINELDADQVRDLRAVYRDALAGARTQPDRPVVIDKMPLNTLAVPLIHLLFPQAKLVFARRHPCDCLVSGMFQNFNANPAMASFLDAASGADFYDVMLSVWTRARAGLPHLAHHLVYEDLVADPDATLRPLFDFIGLDWDRRLLDHRGSARARGIISTASYDQVTEPLHRRSAGRWTRYRDLVAPALPVLLPWAERLGYGDA